jgi:hypothetical protein
MDKTNLFFAIFNPIDNLILKKISKKFPALARSIHILYRLIIQYFFVYLWNLDPNIMFFTTPIVIWFDKMIRDFINNWK